MPDLSTLAGGAMESAVNAAGSSGGITVSDAAQDTKGSWTQLLASTTYATAWVMIVATSTVADSFLFDIGIGASTAEKVLVPDLLLHVGSAPTGPTNRQWLLPLAIPAGSRLSARCASSTTLADAMRIGLVLIGSTAASAPGLTAVEGFGSLTTGSTATVIDPGGATNTVGSWVQLIASTAYDYRWLCLSFSGVAITSTTTWLVDIGIGGSSAEKVLVPQIATISGSANDVPTPGVFSLPISVPAGSRLSARAQCSVATVTERNILICGQGVG